MEYELEHTVVGPEAQETASIDGSHADLVVNHGRNEAVIVSRPRRDP